MGFLTKKETQPKLPRATMVKNKTPAPIQITAEQILREARERPEPEIHAPKQTITDATELADYCLRNRKRFEDLIRRAGCNAGTWVKYAQWEESQKDFDRARSVWERALAADYRSPTLWLKYAEMEMRNKCVNHARNVWDRAVALLPRADQLWCKYIQMEQMLGNVAGASQVFERWMKWQPAKFETKMEEVAPARCCVPKACVEELYGRCRDKEGIEDAIVSKRRFEYEDEVRKNPLSYDSWFDYIRLEESVGIKERVREVYRRAIENVPPADAKRYWQRYIYLWINYALYEELDAQDSDGTREVYRECLDLIPHERFSFAKVWLMAAEFEIRQLNLKGARRILGNAIGKTPKDKIFKKYIEMELQLGNIDRCRKLHEKYLEWSPENCYAWTKYAELEVSLQENDRARAIFELAIAQQALDMPEVLWKEYIEFEVAEGEFERTRQLYERLLGCTKHLKVWASYAKFESSALEDDKSCIQRARQVYERALSYFRNSAPELKEERAMLLEEWLNMERRSGDVTIVRSKLPKKVKRKRPIATEDGPAGFEEYIDYVFPEENEPSNLQILHKALQWKKQRMAEGIY